MGLQRWEWEGVEKSQIKKGKPHPSCPSFTEANPPPPAPLKAPLFYLYKEKLAQRNNRSPLCRNCPIFAPQSSPSPPNHLTSPSVSGPPDTATAHSTSRRQSATTGVTRTRGQRLQSLRATRGVTAAAPDWIWNGYRGQQTPRSRSSQRDENARNKEPGAEITDFRYYSKVQKKTFCLRLAVGVKRTKREVHSKWWALRSCSNRIWRDTPLSWRCSFLLRMCAYVL